MNLPIELYYKILTYGAIEPSHVIAIKDKSNLRPIFNCELNSNITGTIQLNEGYEEDELNNEWLLFLITQEYGIENA